MLLLSKQHHIAPTAAPQHRCTAAPWRTYAQLVACVGPDHILLCEHNRHLQGQQHHIGRRQEAQLHRCQSTPATTVQLQAAVSLGRSLVGPPNIHAQRPLKPGEPPAPKGTALLLTCRARS